MNSLVDVDKLELFELFSQNTDTVFWVRSSNEMLYISPAYEKIWGRSVESLYQNPNSFLEAIHEEDRGRVLQKLIDDIEGKESFFDTYRVVHPNGKICWVQAKSFPIFDSEGIATKWVGVAENVTKLKEAESSLELLNDALIDQMELEVFSRLKSEGLYRSIFENSPEGIFVMSKEGRFLKCNDSAAKMLGFSAEDFVGKSFDSISPSTQSNINRLSKEVGDEYIARALGGEVVEFEWVHLNKNGEEFFTHVLLAPFEKESGELLVMWRNIDEIKKLQDEKKLQEALLIQQSKMAEMGDMISAIAHQWKQPISASCLLIDMFLDDAKEGILTKERSLEIVGNIKKQILFMNQTIDDFRKFLSPSKESVVFDPGEGIQEIASMLKHQFIKQKISLFIHSESSALIKGYPNEFKQLLMNIFKNSYDAFLENGIGQREINIYITKDEKSVVITICDNAGGIKEELLPKRLFDSYVCTKGEGGTGIGLQLVRKITEEHFLGSISAYNKENGACFEFRFPIVEEA